MSLYLATSILVFLIGLIVLCVQRRFNEIWHGMFLAGLIAVLLQFAGHAGLFIK